MLNVSRELSQVSTTHDAGEARVTDDSGSTRSFARSTEFGSESGCYECDPQPPIPVGSRRAWSPSQSLDDAAAPEECDPGCRRACSR